MKRIIPIFLILINVLSANAQIGYCYKDKFVDQTQYQVKQYTKAC